MRQTLTLLLALVLLAGCAGAATPVPPAASPSAGPTAQPTQPPAANSPLPSATPSAVTEATTPPTDAPPATATPAEAAGAAVVWVQGGDLMLKRLPGGEEVALTGEGDVVDFPEFSPDGRLILYRRQGPPATISADPAAEVPSSTFWAIPVAGGTPRLVLDPLAALPAVPGTGSLADDLYPSEPGPLAWLPGGRQALFSSRYLTANSALGSYDLWRLDVETGQLEALLPAGQGGRPTLSPGGEWVLLSTPREVAVARTDGTERRTLLTFERVPTYSEWEWVPEPAWNDDGSVQVALARPWQVGEAVTYSLLRLDPGSDESRELGEVQVPWLHTPLWSPDRSRLAYVAAGSGLALAGGRGENPRTVAAGDMPVPLAWSPEGTHLAFVHDSRCCVVDAQAEEEPLCVAPAWGADAQWWDEDTLVVMADAGEDQPQLQAMQLPSGTATELWTAPPSPLYYDLYLGP